MNTNFREAANSFLDELAEIIENSVQSGKYPLHSKWFEHVRWTPSGWHLDPCRPYPFEMRTKSFNMELCPHQSKEKFARWLMVKESNMGKNAGYALFSDRVSRKMTISLYTLVRKQILVLQMRPVCLKSKVI